MCATGSPRDPTAIDPALAGREVYTIIWTTTPWTLPASHGRGLPSRLRIRRARRQRRFKTLTRRRIPVYIVAAELAASVIAACKLGADARNSPASKAAKLERVTFKHPFLERSILGVLATYVTADTGTGAVHTAPSHGADDFYTGQRYGLDPTCRVDASGRISRRPGRMALRRSAAL